MPRVKFKQPKITPNLMNSLNLGVAQSLGENPYIPISQKKITEQFYDGTGGYTDIEKLIERVNELENELEKTRLLLIETNKKANSALKKSESADKLTHPRMIELTGDVMGLASFDGSEDIEISSNIKRATTENEGIVKLSDSVNNSSTTEAATANSVNILNELIKNLQNKISNIPDLPLEISENEKLCLVWDKDTNHFIWKNISESLGFGK